MSVYGRTGLDMVSHSCPKCVSGIAMALLPQRTSIVYDPVQFGVARLWLGHSSS